MSDPAEIPSDLASALLELGQLYGEDPTMLVYAMSAQIIRYYLGDRWAERCVFPNERADPFMLNNLGDDRASRITHMTRVAWLANCLFKLRNARGFHILYKRFRERETQACFREVQIASWFSGDGWDVEIVQESGRRGNDFDFVATRDGHRINGEVTAKPAARPSEKGVYNTLNSKRDQVPADAPAVLYVVLPRGWEAGEPATRAVIEAATTRFFRSSRRFNAVVYVWEVNRPHREGGIEAALFRDFVHFDPRHPIPALTRLFPATLGHEPSATLDAFSEAASLAERGVHFSPPLSFLEWYNGAVSPRDSGHT